jgi:thiosulfate reductase cytochrome b subunit
MAALLAFVAGHLVMVLLAGWWNFWSMVTGWKRVRS